MKTLKTILPLFFLTFTTVTQAQIYVNAEGKVGIGTTTPSVKMHVEGSVLAENYLYVGATDAYFHRDIANRIASEVHLSHRSHPGWGLKTYGHDLRQQDAGTGVSILEIGPAPRQPAGIPQEPPVDRIFR